MRRHCVRGVMLGLAMLSIATPALGCGGDATGARAVAEGIIAADNERDIGRVLGYYADDVVWLPPDEPAVTDRDAIRRRYEDLFQKFDPDIEARIDGTCVEGDLAVVRGRNGGWLVSRVGGRSRQLDDVWLMVLRRVDGDWKITQLMWHPAHAPAG